MGFYARRFIWNGTPSETFNLYITTTTGKNSGGDDSLTLAQDVRLLTQELLRRPQNYLLAVQQSPVLSFPVEFTTPDEITAPQMQRIGAYLFGQLNYQKLQIVQSDMIDCYYNAFFTAPSIWRVGNLIRGIQTTVTCDAPWAWGFPKTKTYTYTGTSGSNIFFNTSDNVSFMYPQLVCTMSGTSGSFAITNSAEPTRVFSFTGLLANEVLTVDTDHKIITTSVVGVKRLSNFVTKEWLRFLPGKNILTMTGNLSQLSITYQNARKIS